MTTSTNPTSLRSLQFQDHVIRTNNGHLEAVATGYFRDILNDDRDVYVRYLFTEDGYKVYEAYTDSGSVDYLYIVYYR